MNDAMPLAPTPCSDCGLAPGPIGSGEVHYWECPTPKCPSHFAFTLGRTLEEATENWNREQARRAAELAAAEGEAR